MVGLIPLVVPFVPGSANALLGVVGGAKTYRAQKSKKEELRALRLTEGNILQSKANLKAVNTIAEFAKRERSLIPSRSNSPGFSSDDDSHHQDQASAHLASKQIKNLNSNFLSINELKKLSPGKRETLLHTLTVYEKVIGKRIEREEAESSILGGGLGSHVAQGFSGAGQLVSEVVKPSATTNVALNATNAAAAGLGIFSSVMLLGVSAKGMYSVSQELSKNKQRRDDIKKLQQELLQNIPSGSGDEIDTVCDILNKTKQSLQAELDYLNKEKDLLTQSYNYHLFNAVGSFLCILAGILFLLATHGVGPAALIIAYYVLTAVGGLLPTIALIYKAKSTNEAVFVEETQRDLHHHTSTVHNSTNPTRKRANTTPNAVNNEILKKHLLEKLTKSISLLAGVDKTDREIESWIANMIKNNHSYDEILFLLKAWFSSTKTAEIESIIRANQLEQEQSLAVDSDDETVLTW